MKKIFVALYGMLLLFVSCSSTNSLSSSISSSTVVKISDGLVRGSVSNGIYSFKGIPYAEVSKRFTVGKPVQKWSGIFDATKYGSIALQTGFRPGTAGTDNMSENPLNLNVWTPSSDNKKRAVMVWLHGGGAKVLALMETPCAKKLFKRGIVESGATETMGVLWTPKEASERVTELTLENLGLKKGEFEKLQSVPYSALVEASDKALLQAGEEFKIPAALGTGYLIFWEPYVDGDFIPDDIAGKNGFPKNDEKYSLLIGSNLNEWETIQKMGDALWNSGNKITMGVAKQSNFLSKNTAKKRTKYFRLSNRLTLKSRPLRGPMLTRA